MVSVKQNSIGMDGKGSKPTTVKEAQANAKLLYDQVMSALDATNALLDRTPLNDKMTRMKLERARRELLDRYDKASRKLVGGYENPNGGLSQHIDAAFDAAASGDRGGLTTTKAAIRKALNSAKQPEGQKAREYIFGVLDIIVKNRSKWSGAQTQKAVREYSAAVYGKVLPKLKIEQNPKSQTYYVLSNNERPHVTANYETKQAALNDVANFQSQYPNEKVSLTRMTYSKHSGFGKFFIKSFAGKGARNPKTANGSLANVTPRQFDAKLKRKYKTSNWFNSATDKEINDWRKVLLNAEYAKKYGKNWFNKVTESELNRWKDLSLQNHTATDFHAKQNPEIMGRYVSEAVLDNVFTQLTQYYQSSAKDKKAGLPNLVRYLETSVRGLSTGGQLASSSNGTYKDVPAQSQALADKHNLRIETQTFSDGSKRFTVSDNNNPSYGSHTTETLAGIKQGISEMLRRRKAYAKNPQPVKRNATAANPSSTLKDEGFSFVSLKGKELRVKDASGNNVEIYYRVPSGGYSGWTLEYKGHHYEFISSAKINGISQPVKKNETATDFHAKQNPEIMGRYVSEAVLDNVFTQLTQYYQSSAKDKKAGLPNLVRYLELKVGGLSERQAKAYIGVMEKHLMPRKNHTASDFTAFKQNRSKEHFKMFQGKQPSGSVRVLQPDSAPKETSRLGDLVLMKVIKSNGSKQNINFDGEAFLAIDLRKNLWAIGKDARINNVALPRKGELKYLGKLKQIDYVTAKKHIGGNKLTRFWHELGEVDKNYPSLYVDADGFPIIHGGGYDVWNVGIVN